jgi:hypothetical protein
MNGRAAVEDILFDPDKHKKYNAQNYVYKDKIRGIYYAMKVLPISFLFNDFVSEDGLSGPPWLSISAECLSRLHGRIGTDRSAR